MELFGRELDCGCDNRREIMGAENWRADGLIIVGGIVLVLLAIALTK